MKEDRLTETKLEVRKIFTAYLERKKQRKTPIASARNIGQKQNTAIIISPNMASS